MPPLLGLSIQLGWFRAHFPRPQATKYARHLARELHISSTLLWMYGRGLFCCALPFDPGYGTLGNPHRRTNSWPS